MLNDILLVCSAMWLWFGLGYPGCSDPGPEPVHSAYIFCNQLHTCICLLSV
jgi:hypothetical protein